MAENVGVSMAQFDDNFLTVLRNGMIDYAKTPGRRRACRSRTRRTTSPSSSTRSRTSSPPASTRSSSTRSTPRPRRRCRTPPRPAAFRWSTSTASRSTSTRCPTTRPSSPRTRGDSGTLETKEVCRLFKEAGKTEANVYVIMGELSNQAAVQRTAGHPRRDRHAGMRVHQDHRQADLQLAARPRRRT